LKILFSAIENATRIGHARFISTGLQPGADWVREPQPFQWLFSPTRKPLKRLKRMGHREPPG